MKMITGEADIGEFKQESVDVASHEANATWVVVVNNEWGDTEEEKIDKLRELYNGVKRAILRRSKVILITKDRNIKLFKAISSLMLSLDRYDIYGIDSELDSDTLEMLAMRKPSLNEVQTFIDADVAVTSSMIEVLDDISNAVHNNDMETLSKIIEDKRKIVYELASVMSSVQMLIDKMNTRELIENSEKSSEQVKELAEKLERAKEEAERIKNEALNSSDSLDKHEAELEKLKATNSRLEKSIKELQSQLATSGESGIINIYTTYNTISALTPVRNVIYFKEVSRVPYINTMITGLCEYLALKNKRVKLAVYDSAGAMSALYSPLRSVDAQDFLASKDELLRNTKKFVVNEANAAIISELASNGNHCDVLIVYDRMKQQKDIISGNNVSKFFVINSNKDFLTLSKVLMIDDKSKVITREDSSIGDETIRIAKIDNYDGKISDGKMVSKSLALYMRMTSLPDTRKLYDRICEDANIMFN